MKQKILFIMHMPPPVHGAAMVGQYIHDSKLINGKQSLRAVLRTLIKMYTFAPNFKFGTK